MRNVHQGRKQLGNLAFPMQRILGQIQSTRREQTQMITSMLARPECRIVAGSVFTYFVQRSHRKANVMAADEPRR
jgi:hypothetical protein